MKKIELGMKDTFDEAVLERKPLFDAGTLEEAAQAIEEVRARGDAALFDAAEKTCGRRLSSIELGEDEVAAAQAEVDEDFLDALAYAIDNIADFHDRQRREAWFSPDCDGRMVGQRIVPLQRVGVYVEGGRSSAVSDVLTNALPAVAAGVDEVVLCTPAGDDGAVDPYTVVAATSIGVTRIFKVGGAHAIAAMAYGTETVPKVEKVAGCGGGQVAAAKKLVYGDVGVDMLSGPSETCVVADGNAVPEMIVADLLAQAERFPSAALYFVAADAGLVLDVEERLEEVVADLADGDPAHAALDNVTIIACPLIGQVFDVANKIGPGRLEIAMSAPLELMGMVRNAGSVFLGPWTPASLGTYVAGPGCMDVLPGTAPFASALSVDDFVKKIPFVSYSFDALEDEAQVVEVLSRREGADAACDAALWRIDFMDYLQNEVLESLRSAGSRAGAVHPEGAGGKPGAKSKPKSKGKGKDGARGDAKGDAR